MSDQANLASNATTEASGAPPPKRSRGFLLRLVAVVIALAAAGWGVWYFIDGRWDQSTDDAYVSGNVVQVTPQVPGTVISIGADDGDLVHAGDVLVELDPSDAEVALAGAKANLAYTVRKVRGLYSTVRGAKAEVAARQTALRKARADYDRRAVLASSGAISREELAHASDALTSAQSNLGAARGKYQSSQSLVDATVVTSHPEVQAASARVRAAFLDEVRATLLAPVDGYVAKRQVQVGQRVSPGAALMAVVPLNEVWVDANFKETQLTDMRIGQKVDIESDVYGGAVTYKGRIQELGVGTGSAFSLLPAQNATGNWIKIVQRIPVRVTFEEQQQLKQHPLRLGMSVAVTVDLHDRSGPTLAETSPTQPVFRTDIYRQQLLKADAVIAHIVRMNMAGGKGIP
jgi:membrane fusion protein (multidrug efflux system)